VQVEKSRLENLRDDAENTGLYFKELSRKFWKEKRNPLDETTLAISRAAHRLGGKIDALLDKLEDEGLLKG